MRRPPILALALATLGLALAPAADRRPWRLSHRTPRGAEFARCTSDGRRLACRSR